MPANTDPPSARDDPPPSGWRRAATALAGAWLATGLAAFEYRSPALLASDVACGSALIALAATPWGRFRSAPWAVAAIGLWLILAPLIFWAKEPAAAGADTLIGAIVFCLAHVFPGAVGARDLGGRDAAPEWSYNPSAWPQRAGSIALAMVQFFVARHLAAFQLGHVSTAWDPFFGEGTRKVLESDISKAFPVSDAGLGAVMYLIEALTGFLGGPRRWRTLPWAVLLFGVLIIPVGIVSTVLVILQPIAVGAWCGLCLVTAGLTVILIAPAVDEVVATGQFLLHERRRGESPWRAFWKGGSWDVEAGRPETLRRRSLIGQLADGLELTNIPWNLGLAAIAGGWLMAAPAVFDAKGAAAGSDQLCGALILTFAAIGFGEASRAARLVNLPIGLWVAAAPWILGGASSASRWNDLAIGLIVVALSVRKGPIENRFGGWNKFVV